MTFTHKATIHHNPMIFLTRRDVSFHNLLLLHLCLSQPSFPQVRWPRRICQNLEHQALQLDHCDRFVGYLWPDQGNRYAGNAIHGLVRYFKRWFFLMSAKTRWQYEEHLGCWSWSILSRPPHLLRQLQLQNHVPAKQDQNLRPSGTFL